MFNIVTTMVSDSPPGSEPAIVFEWVGDEPLTEDTPCPQSAQKVVPDWYETLSAENDGFRTVKMCVSFGDAMKEGFVIPLTFDLEFGVNDGVLQTTATDSIGVENPVKEYGIASPEQPGRNSTFKPPELRIELPWKIHTPDGYSTLLTYPMNRLDPGVKSYSLLVPTDEYDGPITVPASTTRPFGRMEKGTPVVQAIPIRRDTIISEVKVTDQNDPVGSQIYQGYQERSELVARSAGFYRRECWRPKPNKSVVNQNQSSDGPTEQISELVGEPPDDPFVEYKEDAQKTLRYVVPKSDNGVVPEPSPAKTQMPEWITNPDSFSGVDAEMRRMASWARNAMDLGWYSPIPADCLMSTLGDSGIELSTRYDGKMKNSLVEDEPVISFHDPKQLGEAFPIDWINLVKFISPAIIRAPSGYSILMREPLNHWQHPFRSTSGMSDMDEFCMRATSIGMFLNPDGEFEMSAGAPTSVNIPIHRNSLISKGYIVAERQSNE